MAHAVLNLVYICLPWDHSLWILSPFGLLIYYLVEILKLNKSLQVDFLMFKVPLTYVLVNLLRHVDTPVTPLRVIVVLSLYAGKKCQSKHNE